MWSSLNLRLRVFLTQVVSSLLATVADEAGWRSYAHAPPGPGVPGGVALTQLPPARLLVHNSDARGHETNDMYTLDEGKSTGEGSGIGLFLNVGHWLKIGPQNSKGAN